MLGPSLMATSCAGCSAIFVRAQDLVIVNNSSAMVYHFYAKGNRRVGDLKIMGKMCAKAGDRNVNAHVQFAGAVGLVTFQEQSL
jgi:hypothetical protein